jgi:putative transposase insK for insertion sequence element IS150
MDTERCRRQSDEDAHQKIQWQDRRKKNNIIARDFVATTPNRKWGTDVTQINIGSTKLYLLPILDMFTNSY